MAFKLGNQTVLNLDSDGATQIASASGKDIALYPDQNVWIKQATKLIFEGTTPDDFEVKLQATTVTADRDLILPDAGGTLATQAYVTSAVGGSGALPTTGGTMTGAIEMGSNNITTTGKILFSNLYAAEADLPSASTYHGMFAHVHATGKGYFAHGGAWKKLLDESSSTTTDLTEGTNLYYTDGRADARVTNALAGTVAAITTSGNVLVGGNLTVNGTTNTVSSNEVNIGDNILKLNADETGVPSQDAGLEIERGTSTNVTFLWDEGNDRWTTGGQTIKAGHLLPETDITYDLGSTTLKWRDLYLSGSTIKLGGATLSASGSNLSMGSGSFDLSNSTTANLPEHTDYKYYTDTRVRTHMQGADLDMTTNKILYSNVYSTTGDLPSAGSYHGMFAHVHAEGKGYFAHGGAWKELVDTTTSSTINLQLNSVGVGTAASGTAGDIRATADITAYYSSDATLKQNVVEIENALDKVKKIRGVEFDWTPEYLGEKGGEDGYFVRKHDVGVIAQEVEAVLPEVVGTRDNGIKAVRYDRIVALLIEAIKEQQTQIDELKELVNHKTNK